MTNGWGIVNAVRVRNPRRTVVARKGAGKGGGGGGGVVTPHQPQEQPNTLRSRATVRILELLCEGPIKGPVWRGVSIWQSVYLDGTAIVDLSGNPQFNLLYGEFRNGYPGQQPPVGYTVGENEVPVGVECHPFDPVVRNVTLPVSAIRYKVRIPALYENESDGDVVQASVGYNFDISVNSGPWINKVSERIQGKTMSPYERAVRVEVPEAAGATTLQIRIERHDNDIIPTRANALFFQGFTEIQDGLISYDDSAWASLTVDAEEFQNIPQRAYLIDGMLLQIPDNYFPFVHGYVGDWAGTFVTDWTDNPAWILYGLLTNTRWGLGRFIDAAAVDKWSFYEAGVFNDNNVNGTGPRWTCNCVINTRQDAYSVLQAVATSMLAQLYYANGTIFLVQDRPALSPVRLFGPADVERGLFDYTSTDVRSRYNAVAVTWNDPADNYKPTVELVQDPTLVAQQGYREAQQVMFGCTSRAQAIRWGRWFIFTSQFETEVSTFRTGLENADLRPGSVILLSDPSRVGARLVGRVLDGSVAGEIVLDAIPSQMLADIDSYSIYVTIGSAAEPTEDVGIFVLSGLTIIDAGAGRIGVSGPWPAGGVPAGSMWLARAGAVEPRSFRIASVADRGEGSYEITATEYRADKWSYVDSGILLPPPSFDLIPTGPLTPPANFTYTEFIYRDGAGKTQFGVVLSWSASPDPRVQRYQVEMAGPGGDYRRFSHIAGVAQEVLTMRHGEWTATLMAFDNIGRKTAPIYLVFTPAGLTAKPLPPSALYLTPQGALTTVTWVPTGEIDVEYYWLKWAPETDGSATWRTATTSVARVPYNATEMNTPTRSGTFFIKAIDSLGQESDLYAEAIQLVQRTERVHVIDIDEQPDWGGDFGGLWHLNTGQLWLPPPDEPEVVPAGVFPGDRGVILNKTPTRIGIYGFEDAVDLGMVTAGVSVVSKVKGFGTFFGTVMADWVTLASVDPLASGSGNTMSSWRPLAMAKPLAMGGSEEWDAHIEMRVAQDDAVFSEWSPVKSTLITGQEFEFRLVGTLYDLSTTLRTVEASVTLEVPLRNVQGSDVPLNAITGALTVTYPIPFMATPTVQITARQSLSPGGNIVVTASDEASFSVQHKNAAGTNVGGGSIDYFVQGYGGHAG